MRKIPVLIAIALLSVTVLSGCGSTVDCDSANESGMSDCLGSPGHALGCQCDDEGN